MSNAFPFARTKVLTPERAVFDFCGKGANLPVAQFAGAAAATFGIVAVDGYAIFGA